MTLQDAFDLRIDVDAPVLIGDAATNATPRI